MAKPRIVEVKKLPAKPKIVEQKDKLETEEDFSLLVDTPRDELRRQQLRDIIPSQPRPGEPLQAVNADVRKKIEADRKKRRGLGDDVKNLLGMR